ncbi:hypothetical protein HQ45_05555 [Porphyromonas crevioricanis]|uniref:Outer membrane protein beta-barrel domain-containing protein n=2 Tax=Porphyromonas crevioricanis TaxID=393921 RepID=A0A0A2FJM6_9PORP|nr:hypothetical protein [Porphyromonas crevioricanis]KGN90255.1 hypothetical protein HQ45_05555 [Porphyromonas crevioricanis]KGN96355.1 hypothetical protein HQ38_01820 [Porphyromonas crevioricanis]SJZ95640.1 hypothetical protein SAMN02745203_01388 [Porphyromonas crevioricanis]SQH72686.1 Uncharacterised protein [Porphyromonas crevioricanis]GAD07443.1 hypothetical protein PORCAN_1064 [Porphyromonas crevioricanis JCM 13913]
MKKILLSIISFFALSVGMVNAQSTTFDQGTGTLNLGIGMGSSLYSKGYNMLIPPVSLAYDHCVLSGFLNQNGSVGLGGYTGFTSSRLKYGNAKADESHIVFGVRGTLHYEFIERLDTYLGLMIGYGLSTVSSNIYNVKTESEWNFANSGFFGIRYFFTPAWGAFFEAGSGISYATIGATMRF